MKKILKVESKIQHALLKKNTPFSVILFQLLNSLKKNIVEKGSEHIYIDVSNFAALDNKTGIQRVVREVIYQLLVDPRFKDRIHFIIATKKIGYRIVEFSQQDNIIHFARDKVNKNTPLVKLSKNDIYLGLDFAPNIVPEHFMQFIKWRLVGVKLIWVLYDLLPLQHPEWFTSATQATYLPWFKTLLITANDILCISETVKHEVKDYAYRLGLTPKVSHIQLGYGFHSDIVREPKPSMADQLKQKLESDAYALMVGTLEPRKGHLEVVNAFIELWKRDLVETPLVLVGKRGWNIEQLETTMTTSPFYNKRLFWLEQVNDEDLDWLYNNSQGVIVASYGEGYGLPLIEAILKNKHVLARELTVFREVAKNRHNVSFFESKTQSMSEIIHQWIKSDWLQDIVINENHRGIADWEESVNCIYQSIHS